MRTPPLVSTARARNGCGQTGPPEAGPPEEHARVPGAHRVGALPVSTRQAARTHGLRGPPRRTLLQCHPTDPQIGTEKVTLAQDKLRRVQRSGRLVPDTVEHKVQRPIKS